jgi:hypothetical protein
MYDERNIYGCFGYQDNDSKPVCNLALRFILTEYVRE